MTTATEYKVRIRRPHDSQKAFLNSRAKRKMLRAGRRAGKTTVSAINATKVFLQGLRVLYATPTSDQIGRFWFEVTRALAEPIDAGVFYKNESMRIIERSGTEQRIRAKTAWNADTLRGDFADLLILDEWQLMNEDAWELVGAPMLLDNNGDAVFIYTPPSLHSRSVTKAHDPRHASRMYQRALSDDTGRWAAFHFTSHDNPHISAEALRDITFDMTATAIRQEIEAEDVDEAPGALWTRAILDATRKRDMKDIAHIVIGVDPPGGVTECGIVAVGIGNDGDLYVLRDESLRASPDAWAGAILDLYVELGADVILGEKNFGGDMVANTINTAAAARKLSVNYKDVNASRGKAVRAQPVAAMFEQGRAHIIGELPHLEEELTGWVPGISSNSPNRLDAMVWGCTIFLDMMQQPDVIMHDERVEISRY
ncbi:MAG: hypothetical protein ACE5HM_04380 [Acidiferrobacterales bacterium]